ncbi:MAG: assimilatory sulfite reductase (NADPH) flavoprotein subunit [Methylohalobius sp.]|nr:assimilatory sulfite reductase (NADPH) flavoprotein subunit [Methylohalobius sp.]
MAERLILIPVRTSKQGMSLNAGKMKKDYCEETSTIELNRQDMAKWGLKKGDKVRLRRGNVEAIVLCKDRKGDDSTSGLAFMAYGPVTSLFMDEDTAGTGMPASKHLEVELEGPIGEDGQVISRPAAEQALGAPCPLTPEQLASLNALMRAPLSPTQAAWLSGYFFALSGAQPVAQAVAQPAAALPLMTILYGSHTGNGEGIAETLMQMASAEGLNARLCDMAEFDPQELEREQLLFVIVSTHGEGDPPLAAEKLHAYLKDYSGPPLENLKYAVFALGDSSYRYFCQTGKDFDQYLQKAGANRILERVDADVDFEEPAKAWMDQVLKIYRELAGQAQPSAAAAPLGKKAGYGKTNPYPAQVMVNVNLNGKGSAKETRHIEIDLGQSNLNYEPGDALGVYPENNLAYVEDLLAALDMSGEESVQVGKETVNLRQAFTNLLDITALSQPLIAKYAELVESESLRALLDDEQAYNNYTWGRQILDLVKEYPPRGLSAQEFVNLLRKIPPRLYSIASSLKAYPNQAHLLVGVVRYHSFGRDREGVCSNYLARAKVGEHLPVYIQANKYFRLPEDGDVPIIMVGPGTGLAPFRAFLQERRVTGCRGKNWLFFGDQHQATDFLYGEELLQMHRDGLLTRLDLAFSRDQERKIYVQHRMLENSKELYSWLEEGACFYVCGDASRMAKDVHQALRDIIAKEGGKTDPEEYLNNLTAAKRYLQDVY